MSRAPDTKDELVVPLDAVGPASTGPARPKDEPPGERAQVELTAIDLPSVLPTTSGSGLLLAGLLLSALLHVGLLLYLQTDVADVRAGLGGVELRTVNVDLVPASAFRAGVPNQALDFGGDTLDRDKTEKTEAARKRATTTTPPEALIKPTDGDSKLAAAQIVKPDPAREPRDEETDKEKLDESQMPNNAHGPAQQTQAAQPELTKGGASSVASPGQMSNYALSIREAIGRHVPKLRVRGRGVVAFELTETGAVRFVQIARSSGAKALDDAVLATIWKTQFPVPPHGMTDKERYYTVPFDFR